MKSRNSLFKITIKYINWTDWPDNKPKPSAKKNTYASQIDNKIWKLDWIVFTTYKRPEKQIYFFGNFPIYRKSFLNDNIVCSEYRTNFYSSVIQLLIKNIIANFEKSLL